MSNHYDIVVIGAGPAGESAAMNAIKHCLKVAVVDAGEDVGGGCTHCGTIPSKALRHTVHQLVRSKKILGIQQPRARILYKEIIKSAQSVINKQVGMRNKFYVRNGVDVYQGWGTFTAEKELSVELLDGGKEALTADKFILATGASPWHPSDVDFEHPFIFDSDTILEMDITPKKVIIYGAGVIGCEYASIFSGMGIKVDLINSRERLLEFLDDEISDALAYHLRDLGVMVRHRENYKSITGHDDGVTIELESGKKVTGDCLIWCNGRSGNSVNMGLETIGVAPNKRGQIEVDNRYCSTEVDYIYAAGDIIGWPSLASAAYNQGRAASAAARGKENIFFVDDVPTGIYTIPEISSVGKTERELTEECIPYEVGRAFFKGVARAQITDEEVGMLKILFDTETYEILGIHCFGAEATEIIHIGQAIMKQKNGGNDIRYFITTTFNYPTMAEAYRIAALNGVNRVMDN